ncbi:class I SAM-dependent methyltransferase [uncultured Rhodoblastus sp.]|uniref:class I SAM-dependent methyltransferase n=1 Tax=uncultured Rhodoblastus sp. TaxID=543037 RepID=UPI0025EAB209|nr:class I SAM-dependent methyltransferase [uncultured Rhodoblastus sp.]
MAQLSQLQSAGLGWVGRTVRQVIEGPFGLLLKSVSLDHNVLAVLERRAVSESADYIEASMPQALGIATREGLWDFAIRNAEGEGLWLEFGVYKAYSLNYIARSAPGSIYGFDSFQGLQEDWAGVGHAKGTFDLAGRLPRVRPNVKLLAGWFRDTLPGFLASNPGPVALLHIDCDTCPATKEVLDLIKGRLTPNSVVILDDYHGFRGYREGQFNDGAEFVAAERFDYRCAALDRQAVVIQDLSPAPPGEPSSPKRTTGA